MNSRTPQFRLVCLALSGLLAVSATSSGMSALIDSASGVTASWMRHWQNRPIAVAPAKDAPNYDPASRGGLWPRSLRELHMLNRVQQGRIYADETMASLLLQSQGGSLGGGGGAPGESGAPVGSGGMVNTLNGNRMSVYPLVDWPSRGASGVDFTLVHNSLSTYSHELGTGWTHSYDVSITYGNDLATIRYEDGLEVPYTRAADQGSTWTFTRPAGYFSVLTRAGANGNWTLKNKRNEIYRFNPDGWLIEVEDRFGNKVTVARNSSNKVTSVTCPSGRVLTLSYTSGRITGLSDPMSRSWSISYSGNDLDKITYPTIGGSSPQRDFDYNGSNDITQETDLRGKLWTYTYSGGKLLTAKNPLNEETSYSYATNVTTITLPGGQTQEHHYSNGLLASKKDGQTHTVQFQDYTSDRQATKLIDQRGKIWGYTFDSSGNLVTMRTPLNVGTSHEWAYVYNSNHDVVAIIDPLGNETEIEYDGLKPWRVFDPLMRQQAEFTFNSTGNLTAVIDANQKTWSFTVDTHGNTTHSSTPLANTTSVYQYNTLGRLTHVTEPLGQVSQTEYDNWMRPWRFVHPGGADVELTFDHEDNVLTVTDERNKTGTYLYDDAGRVDRFTNARGDVEDYTFNSNGWLWKVKNGRNVERVYTYNSRGEVTKLEHPGQSDEQWTYLPTGQVQTYHNGLFLLTCGYDDAGRLTLVDYPTGTTDTSFTYDNADRAKTMVRGSATTEWFYNAASELTKFESPEGKIEYEYRLDGLLNKMIRQATNVTEYSYDDAGRLTSLKNPLNEITSFLYDRNSRLVRKSLHNGTDILYGYDNRSRPVNIDMQAEGDSIIWQGLGYDAASNITSHTINLVTTNYTYDDINQLLTESRPGHSMRYTYDANGNRAQREINFPNGPTEEYNYDSGDKLTSVTWTGGSKSYTYDAAGRLETVTTGGVTTTLGYDHDNRVTSITRSGMTTNTFAYNGFGTRVSKTDSTGTRTYLRDGVGVTSPLLADGAATYTPGISERRGSATTYQLDGLKNTFAQSNASGGHVSSRNYDAFGAVTSSSGTHQGPFGYGGAYGYQTDPDTGLMLLGHRYYDSSTGRFLTRDPIKDGRNWYGYGGGYANPVNSADPEGLHPVLAVIGAGVLLVDGVFTIKDLIEDPHDPINWLSIIPIAKPIKWGKRIGDAWGAIRSSLAKPNPGNVPAEPRYRLTHSVETMEGSNGQDATYNYWKNKSIDEIVDSLRKGHQKGGLTIEDGAVTDGNTRSHVLMKHHNLTLEEIVERVYPKRGPTFADMYDDK